MASISTLIGRVQNERGFSNEEKVLRVLEFESRPTWIKTVRKASFEEDRKGIDILVETDVGKLFVQVKSSNRGREEFLERRRSSRISVIVAKANEKEADLAKRVFAILIEARAKIVKERVAY